MSESDDIAEGILVAVAGIFVGFLVAALLSSKTALCPVCKQTINSGTPTCPHCGVQLKW
ncbi:hypothetical protein [Methanorbis furvi]|uniref:hypothetical protein n=1 Tax=Methanorbis furvi TaxID=3028299 RepID=UPI0030B885A1